MIQKAKIPQCDFIHVHEDVVERVHQEMPDEDTLFELSELFKIFGDSTRIKILYVLFESEMCVCDIAQLLNMTQSAISHQLQVLNRVLLLGRRPCTHHFRAGHGTRCRIKNLLEVLIMKKHFKLIDLDCANCAAKMEDAIKKIDGVNDATVSFMTQKMTVDADDSRFDEIMKKIVKTCKRVEPDCTIVL
jgi:DNA-binding transcriptional ArsR family regulator